MTLNEAAGDLNTIAATIGKIAGLLESIQGWVFSITGFFHGLGLTDTQSYAITAVLFLVSILGILRFLQVITKVLIVALIVWVAASLIGIL